SCFSIEIISLAERGHYRRIQIGNGELAGGSQFLEEIAVADQHGIVSAFEVGRASDIVKGRGLNESDANARQILLHALNYVAGTIGVGVEDFLVEGPITAIVHAEHDRHYGGFVGEDISLEAEVDGAAATARNAVAAPSRVHEGYLHLRKAREHIGFSECGVEALVGDAIAIEDHAVSILEIERGLRENGGD